MQLTHKAHPAPGTRCAPRILFPRQPSTVRDASPVAYCLPVVVVNAPASGIAHQGISLERINRAAVLRQPGEVLRDHAVGDAQRGTGTRLQAKDGIGDENVIEIEQRVIAACLDAGGGVSDHGVGHATAHVGNGVDPILPAVHDAGPIDRGHHLPGSGRHVDAVFGDVLDHRINHFEVTVGTEGHVDAPR